MSGTAEVGVPLIAAISAGVRIDGRGVGGICMPHHVAGPSWLYRSTRWIF